MSGRKASDRPWLKRGRLYVAGLPLPPSVNLRVTFKHEGEASGIPFGPVLLFDVSAYDAWRAKHCPPGSIGIPYGSKPDGMIDLGCTLSRSPSTTASNCRRLRA